MEETNPDHSIFPQQMNEEPPVLPSPDKRNKECGLFLVQNEATDCTRFICDIDGNAAGLDLGHFSNESLLTVHPFPWENIWGRYQACSHANLESGMNLMTNSSQNHSFLNPQVCSKSITSGGGMHLHKPVFASPCPEGDMNRFYQSYTHDNRPNAENLMNGAPHIRNSQSPQIDQNFLISKGNEANEANGFHMNRECGQPNGGGEYRSQINRDFVSLAGSNPGLYHAHGSRELGIGNSSMVSAVKSNFQEHMDGSFLTLGIGGNTEAGYKSIVCSDEIDGESERLAFPKLNAFLGQQTNISSNPVHNLVDGFSSFQNNVGGFSSLGENIGGRNSSNNDLGGPAFPQLNISFGQTISRTSVNPVQNMDSHLASWKNNVAEFSNPTNDMGVWPSSNHDIGAICGINAENHFPSICHALQTPQVDGQQYLPMPSNRNFGLGVNINPQSANIDPCRFQVYSAATRPVGQSGVPDFGLQSLSDLLAESAKTKRMILTQQTPDQFHECQMNFRNSSSGSSMPSSVKGMECTTRQEQSGNLGQTQDRGPIQSTKDLLGPGFASGQGITVAKGHGLPSRDHHGHPLTDGQVNLVADRNVFPPNTNFFSVPSRKRSAVQSLPITPIIPRRKTRLQPSIRPSIPLPIPMARPLTGTSTLLRHRVPQPSINPPVPSSAVPHVKWQGFDASAEPSGQQCLICKRDVSYTPEGHIFQPAIPPAVAVLPCGHIFHDHCLQLITPKDQSKDPPCIPCAIGET